MELFDLLKSFFNQSKWEEASSHDKAKNFFMVNRIMSISFPLQSNAFNNTKIDPASVVEFWRSTLNQKYKAVPGWFFTSTNKKEKKDIFIPGEEVSSFIKSKYEISDRELKELYQFYPKEFKLFCKSIEDLLT